MADALQVINTGLNLMNFLRENQQAKDAARAQAANKAEMEATLSGGEAPPTYGDPASKPPGMQYTPGPIPKPAAPESLLGLIMGGQQGQTMQEAPPQPLPTNAPPSATSAGTAATTTSARNPQEQSSIPYELEAPPEPDAAGALPPPEFLEPADPNTAGALARGWSPENLLPRSTADMYEKEFNKDKDGAVSITYKKRDQDSQNSLSATFMAQHIRNGGKFGEGIRKLAEHGVVPSTTFVTTMGESTFQSNYEKNMANIDADPRTATKPYALKRAMAAQGASETMGGYFPPYMEKEIHLELDAEAEALKTATRIRTEAGMASALEETAHARAAGSTKGQIEAEAAMIPTSTAIDWIKHNNEPISDELAARFGLTPGRYRRDDIIKMAEVGALGLNLDESTRRALPAWNQTKEHFRNLMDLGTQLFTGVDSSDFARYVAGGKARWETFFGSDKADLIQSYEAARKAAVGALAQLNGEAGGRLSDQDAQRYLNTLPAVGQSWISQPPTARTFAYNRANFERGVAAKEEGLIAQTAPYTATSVKESAANARERATAIESGQPVPPAVPAYVQPNAPQEPKAPVTPGSAPDDFAWDQWWNKLPQERQDKFKALPREQQLQWERVILGQEDPTSTNTPEF